VLTSFCGCGTGKVTGKLAIVLTALPERSNVEQRGPVMSSVVTVSIGRECQ
jgi:hypothetical protein